MTRKSPHPNRHRWTAAEVWMLGRLTDGEIAERLGIDRGTVWRERKRRGIAPAGVRPNRRKAEEQDG